MVYHHHLNNNNRRYIFIAETLEGIFFIHSITKKNFNLSSGRVERMRELINKNFCRWGPA